MTRLLAAALLALVSTAASAQDAPALHLAPYTVMVAGNVADLWTTKAAFDAGAHEGNGLTSTTRIAPIALSKACFAVGLGLAMRQLERHGHPRIAQLLGYVDGGVTFAAAAHNARLTNALQRKGD